MNSHVGRLIRAQQEHVRHGVGIGQVGNRSPRLGQGLRRHDPFGSIAERRK